MRRQKIRPIYIDIIILCNGIKLGHLKSNCASSIISQGPLITDERNSCKWTGPTVGLSKPFIRVKISENFFLMDRFLDRRVIEVIVCIRLLLHLKTFKIKSKFVVCSIPCLCVVKNGEKW